MIQNYKEHQEKLPFGDKILYRTRIEGTLGEDVCAIQSEYMESEDESREQAAREAVSLIQCQRTDRGSICSPPSITGTHSSFSVTEGPPSIAGDHTMAEDTPCDEASLRKWLFLMSGAKKGYKSEACYVISALLVPSTAYHG